MTYIPETPLIARLRATLSEKPPYCSGVLSLPEDHLEIYYGQANARFVNFTEAIENPAAVEALASACKPAAFGWGQETVLDETYQKAGKMDANSFMTRFDVERSGLMRVVHTSLLAGKEERRAIRAELYKLNVYREGAFFKPHQDTPRSTEMFGTLVVVLPAPHEGGALILRHDGQEWTFDSNELLAGRTDAVAYVAFFSDVVHEVLPVRAGHRVTLTYNLYYGTRVEDAIPSPPGLSARIPPHASVVAVQEALRELLSDTVFLPNGGTLGFGLRHQYPFPKIWEGRWMGREGKADPNPLECLSDWLKGGDDALFRACMALGLKPYLRIVISGVRQDVLLDRMTDLDGETYGCSVEMSVMEEQKNAQFLDNTFFGEDLNGHSDDDHDYGHDYDRYERYPKIMVYWMTHTEKWNGLASHYVVMGNEASLEHLYARICLLVEVGPPEQRVGQKQAQQENK